MTIKTTDAFRAAKAADDAYSQGLLDWGVERYTLAGSGMIGSALRILYDAKLAADRELSDAFARDREEDGSI